MTTTVKMLNTNYSVSTTSETMRAEGQYSVNKDGDVMYTVTLYKLSDEGNVYAGSVSISGHGIEYSYNYNVSPENKKEAIELTDSALLEIKEQLESKKK